MSFSFLLVNVYVFGLWFQISRPTSLSKVMLLKSLTDQQSNLLCRSTEVFRTDELWNVLSFGWFCPHGGMKSLTRRKHRLWRWHRWEVSRRASRRHKEWCRFWLISRLLSSRWRLAVQSFIIEMSRWTSSNRIIIRLGPTYNVTKLLDPFNFTKWFQPCSPMKNTIEQLPHHHFNHRHMSHRHRCLSCHQEWQWCRQVRSMTMLIDDIRPRGHTMMTMRATTNWDVKTSASRLMARRSIQEAASEVVCRVAAALQVSSNMAV